MTVSRAVLACTLLFGTAAGATAGPIGPDTVPPPTFVYSPGAVPFESFDWTPLDLAAFAAYGGDFANIRRPESGLGGLLDPLDPPANAGPEDEYRLYLVASFPNFEDVRFEDSPLLLQEQEDTQSIPEPGALALVGAGLLAVSHTLRRRRARRLAGS